MTWRGGCLWPHDQEELLEHPHIRQKEHKVRLALAQAETVALATVVMMLVSILKRIMEMKRKNKEAEC